MKILHFQFQFRQNEQENYIKLKKYVNLLKSHTIFRFIDCLNGILYERIEKNYVNHYNRFLYILDFETLFWKIVFALLVYGILNNNIYSFLKDLNKPFFVKFTISLKTKPLFLAFLSFYLTRGIQISVPYIQD